MKIAFILNSSGLYGANRSLLGLIKYLIQNGVDCFAIIPQKGEIEQELQENGVEYALATYRSCVWYPQYVGLPFLVNLINIPKIADIIRKWDVDIVHTNNSSHDVGFIVARLLGKKHVWHVREIMEHNYETRNIFPKLYKKFRAKSDTVICVSKFVYDYHMEHYPNPNMKVIYNPYDIEYYNISRDSFASKETVKILMAGNFTRYKRQIDSVKAVKILVERGINNIKLTLVGSGEKKCIDEIKDYIHMYQLENWIELLNFVPDLRKIRRETDIALCCSVDEALPRVVVEGMLSELLAIGANSGGVAELIENGVTGLLYDVGNCEQLADKIEYAVFHKCECREMIIKAKQYAIDNFELEHSGEKVLKLYNELLKSQG